MQGFDGAGSQFSTCLQRYATWTTEDEKPFESAKFFHNNSFVLISRGLAPDATDSADRAWKLRAKANAPKNSLTLIYRFTHACWVYMSGKPALTLALH